MLASCGEVMNPYQGCAELTGTIMPQGQKKLTPDILSIAQNYTYRMNAFNVISWLSLADTDITDGDISSMAVSSLSPSLLCSNFTYYTQF